jgi:transcriptional regulator with XRE-family HTH domain
MSTRIREFRKLRNMTLQQLAQRVGTTPQTIQRLETENMTVSLDWLQRIADAFGVPAAALIVSDTTASVKVIGELGTSGEVALVDAAAPETMQSLVIAAPTPVAVRVIEHLADFPPGTHLIGNRIEFDPEILMEGRNCIVALASGQVVFRRLTSGAGVTSLEAPEGTGFGPAAGGDIKWIAPILMSVRYHS